MATLVSSTRLLVTAHYTKDEGFSKADLASLLRSASESPAKSASLTWLGKDGGTTLVERTPYQNARQALDYLNQLSYPKDVSLSDALGQTQHFLDTVQALAADRLGQLIHLDQMSAVDFFAYFDGIVDRMPHSLLKAHFQRWLAAQEAKSFDTFEVKRAIAANIQQRLKRLDLRVECPGCRVPANFRCVRYGNSKTGQFGFGHRTGRSECKHCLTTHFPPLTLVPAPKDPRLKVL